MNRSLEDGTALIATLGLDWFLQAGGKAPVIKERDLKAATRFQDTLKRRFSSFLESPTFDKPQPGQLDMGDYASVREALLAFDADSLAVRLSAISDPEYKVVVGEAVTRAVELLKQRMPPELTRSPGSHSDFKSASFMRAWRTLSRPLSLVEDMEVGYLCRDQVDTLAGVFPALYEDISTALLEAVIEREAKAGAGEGKAANIPYKKLKQVSVMLSQPLMSEDLKGLLAQSFGPEEQQTSSGRQMAGSATDASLTNLQKREFGVS